MGARECFGRLFGPDLADRWKDGPAYYARIFALTGTSPAEALVVDDSPEAVSWAVQAGAQAILVRAAAGAARPDVPAIPALRALPAMLAGADR